MSFPSHGKVLFSATLVRGHIAKFHIPYLKWFKEQGWETWVSANNDYPDGTCEIPYCDHFVNIDFARSPFSSQTVVAYQQLRKLFARERFDLVHTHTPVGGVLTRLAARNARSEGTRIIYTAHGFHFYDGAPLANWLLWYPIERVMSRFADVLVTINHEDFERAKRFAHCRVEYVPGVGVDLSRLERLSYGDSKRRELGVDQESFAILSVGDLIPRKNQALIIRALALLPPDFRLLICGDGAERANLESLSHDLGVNDRVQFLGFRNDVPAIMTACDCLAFPSIHEGLPVSVMEAMGCGLPVVASRIRGIDPDLIEDGVTGMFFEKNIPEALAEVIRSLGDDPALARTISENARRHVRCFDVSKIMNDISKIYEEALER